MAVKVLNGDVFAMLETLDDESVDCVVTSPPYWGLRDYGGVDGQIGQEPTLAEHIETLVRLFREIRRVLKKEGTVWLNYGDAYASAPNGNAAASYKDKDDRTFRDKPINTIQGNFKAKDKLLIPHRLAIALQDDGWWVRADIVWAKPNPMPESTKDRPTSSKEFMFLLTKSARYFYDAEAVRTPYQESSIGRLMQSSFDTQTGGPKDPKEGNRSHRKVLENIKRKSDKQRGHSRRHNGFNDRWDHMSKEEQQSMGANLRDVWWISTKAFPDAHFATFPPALVEPCIKAGCPKGGLVLDPFGGSGTTGLVADQLGRDAVLIELNPEYAEMARNRIKGDAPLLANVT